MMKTGTVQEMRDYLDGLVQIGKGDMPIFFDTEARTFNYHMAKIDHASYDKETCEAVGYDFVALYESTR